MPGVFLAAGSFETVDDGCRLVTIGKSYGKAALGDHRADFRGR